MRGLDRTSLALAAAALVAAGCNRDPSDQLDQTVDYRTVLDGGAISGERGTVKITEILWSGSIDAEGNHDSSDVYLEFRNEGARPINLSGWRLELDGAQRRDYRLPQMDLMIDVGQEVYAAAKTTGCFPEPDFVIEGLAFPQGDPFELTLLDADERLMEGAGSEDQPPFAGGYDLVTSYSMERIHLMFGGRGDEPQSWHYFNKRDCPRDLTRGEGNAGLTCFEGRPNNQRIAEGCRAHTLGTPGMPNSPDYSGARASGGFE